MNFEEFQNLARLFVVGALEGEDLDHFQNARGEFGSMAEDYIRECHKLNDAFALSLRPMPPRPETRERLLAQIRASMQETNGTEKETAIGER